MFQNLRVQSPAPVTMVLPSGLIARQRTLQVWPVSVQIFSILGYFQMLIQWCEKPWVDTISLRVLLNIRLHTCDPTSTVLIVVPVRVFRKRMVRSAVPPPETNSPCWCGDQVMALTAAMWSLYFRIGSLEWVFQTNSLLSLPPEHNCCSSKLHFNPHISCLCPINLSVYSSWHRKSLWRIVLSREPVLRMVEFQEMAPTLLVCPRKTLVFFILFTSHICTQPLLVPSAKLGPLGDHETEVAESEIPKSQSLVTLLFCAFHMQTLEARPTARKFCVDQSMRFKQQSSCKAGASRTLQGSLLIFLRLAVSMTMRSFSFAPLLSPLCRLYRSKFLFSQFWIECYSPPLFSPNRHFLYKSDIETLDSGRFSFQSLGSCADRKESCCSNLRLGIKRSVTALCPTDYCENKQGVNVRMFAAVRCYELPPREQAVDLLSSLFVSCLTLFQGVHTVPRRYSVINLINLTLFTFFYTPKFYQIYYFTTIIYRNIFLSPFLNLTLKYLFFYLLQHYFLILVLISQH